MSRVNTPQDFINKSNRVHNFKYNYSKIDYKGTSSKVEIICPIHSSFFQAPNSHMTRHGCPKCGIDNNKKTKEEFLKEANFIHGNKYEYPNLKFSTIAEKITIVCPEHGAFSQDIRKHLMGRGCWPCKTKSKTKTTEEFINESNKVHNFKFDYSKCEYETSDSKVIIICPTHGEYSVFATQHVQGKDCKKCADAKMGYDRRITLEQFIAKAKEFHGDRYDYSACKYESYIKKVEIICKTHGSFMSRVVNHLQGTGCPKCSEPKGEFRTRKFLEENNIKFETQKWFDDCRNPRTNYPLKFDFYLPEHNILIEYDGKQHYSYTRFENNEVAEKDLENTKFKDSVKNQYAKDKNIKLIRIPYFKVKDISKILSEALQTSIAH